MLLELKTRWVYIDIEYNDLFYQPYHIKFWTNLYGRLLISIEFWRFSIGIMYKGEPRYFFQIRR